MGLAKYMPQGHVTAIDISADILQSAAQHAEKVGVTNVSFQTGSIFALPFPDESFDVVHAHQVLCHLDSPVEAVKELLRVVKRDGGVVASRECEMVSWSWWPRLGPLQQSFQIHLATHEANGGSNTAGTQLISWALKAGASREQITATMGTWCYNERAEKEGWGMSMFGSEIRF